MPGWSQLSDRDIVVVLTYLRASWDNRYPPVAESTITEVRSSIGKRTVWTAGELKLRPQTSRINESWSMDFMADQLFNRQRFRKYPFLDFSSAGRYQ